MDYFKHLKLKYNKEELKESLKDSILINSSHLSQNNAWLYSIVNKNKIIDLYNQVVNLTGSNDIEIRYVVQKANCEVKIHSDLTHLCAINIMLSNNNGPLILENKEINYECLFFDTQKKHSVPSHPNDRIVLKFGIRDKTYVEASRFTPI